MDIVTIHMLTIITLCVLKACTVVYGDLGILGILNYPPLVSYSMCYGMLGNLSTLLNLPTYSPNLFSWVDRYIGAGDSKGGAIRNVCWLWLSTINFTGLIASSENVSLLVMLIVLCQLAISLVLALRFTARCPDATMENNFIFHLLDSKMDSLNVAQKQRAQGVLPPFSPWLFCVVLLSSFNTLGPSYCCSDEIVADQTVGSPVSEGALICRRSASAGRQVRHFLQLRNTLLPSGRREWPLAPGYLNSTPMKRLLNPITWLPLLREMNKIGLRMLPLFERSWQNVRQPWPKCPMALTACAIPSTNCPTNLKGCRSK